MGRTSGWTVTVAAVLLGIGTAGCTHLVHWEDMEGAFDDVNARMDEQDSRLSAVESDLEGLRGDVDELRREMQRMEEDLNARIDSVGENMMGVSLPVHFDFDVAEIREVDRPILDAFAASVQRSLPEALVTVEGFADPAGSVPYNMRLSRERAENVRDYLVERGLSEDNVRVDAFGELRSRQVNPGAQGPGQSGIENRRVSFVIEWAGAEGARTEPGMQEQEGQGSVGQGAGGQGVAGQSTNDTGS